MRNMVRLSTGVAAWVGVTEILLRVANTKFKSATLGGAVFCGVLAGYLVHSRSSLADPLRLMTGHGKCSTSDETEHRVIAELVSCIEVLSRIKKGEKLRLVMPYMAWYYGTHNAAASPQNDPGATQSAEAVMYYINRRFKEVLLEEPGLVEVRLLYVGFLLRHARNYILAWEINEGSTGSRNNIIQRFQAYHYLYQFR